MEKVPFELTPIKQKAHLLTPDLYRPTLPPSDDLHLGHQFSNLIHVKDNINTVLKPRYLDLLGIQNRRFPLNKSEAHTVLLVRVIVKNNDNDHNNNESHQILISKAAENGQLRILFGSVFNHRKMNNMVFKKAGPGAVPQRRPPCRLISARFLMFRKLAWTASQFPHISAFC